MENSEIKVEKENKEGTLYWTKKEPRKSFATFQRNQNKLMANSLNQIDRKAAIMIRMNTTIVSGIIVFFKYISEISSGVLIGSVLVMSLATSLILAILAVKPPLKKSMKKFKSQIMTKYPDAAANLFLVGASIHLSLEEYEKGYDEVVKNQELQIGNAIRTMYVFENNINYSFRMIEYAYNAFIFGFLFSVIVFLITNLTHLLG
jgi:hypothetical protein